MKKSFLTSDSVKPVGHGPIVVSSEQSYSRVAAMRTQAANGKEYIILFLLTGESHTLNSADDDNENLYSGLKIVHNLFCLMSRVWIPPQGGFV